MTVEGLHLSGCQINIVAVRVTGPVLDFTSFGALVIQQG